MPTKKILLGCVFAVTIYMLVLAAIPHRTNCGGNTAAMYVVSDYLWLARGAVEFEGRSQFDVASPSDEERDSLRYMAHNIWISRNQLLVSKIPYKNDSASPRRVLIVCDRAFTNVPRRVFGKAPPTHAAGFSDGKVALISPAEFAALDRSTFVPLRELFPESPYK